MAKLGNFFSRLVVALPSNAVLTLGVLLRERALNPREPASLWLQ